MKIIIPHECPACKYPLQTVNEQLFCRNTACPAQLGKKLEHFCKALSIKGMGAKTIEKLNLQDITEVYYLDLDEVTNALGSSKVAQKLLAEIESSKGASLEEVLPALSIPLFGNTAASKLCSVVSSLDEVTLEKCKEAGLGDKVSHNLITYIETELKTLKEFLPFSFKVHNRTVPGNTNGKTVCITGKLSSFKTKAEASVALATAGFKVVETVNKSTNYLVDESNKGSSKRQTAESLGISIITNLSEFLKENNT